MRYFESEFVVNQELATRLVKEFFASFNPRNVMKLDGQSAKVKIFFEDAHQCGIVDVIGEASEIQKFTYNGDDEVQEAPLKHEGKEVQEEVQKEIQKEVTIEPKPTAEPSEVKESSKRSKRKSKVQKQPTKAKESTEPGIYKSTFQRFYPWIDEFAQGRSGEEFFIDIGHELGFVEGTPEWSEYTDAIKIALKKPESQKLAIFAKKLEFNERDKLISFRRKINDSIEKRYPGSTLKGSVIISRVVHYLNEKNFSFDESKTQGDKTVPKNDESDSSEVDSKNDNME